MKPTATGPGTLLLGQQRRQMGIPSRTTRLPSLPILRSRKSMPFTPQSTPPPSPPPMAPLGERAEAHQRERATANYPTYPAPTSTRADTEFSVSRVCGAYAGRGDRTAEHRADALPHRVGTLSASEASEQYRSQYPPMCEAAFAAEWQANIGPYRTDVANNRVPEQTVSISPAKVRNRT